ncbi:hypothetical protein GQ44DRAFT_823827 [Phaeosphaeriaceae sp. PMI808]|nr:hypothetical protein GQ44DRAFT_823827 [Phaeosphaeriaceae sp. PMI808]
MNRPGPSTQSLRNIPANMFNNQQNANRGAPLGTNRLQNGKLAGASQWAFGGAMGGLPNPQARTNGSSFAQAMTGSQPHTPLNLEEFPSLSGAPQTQQNTTAQQMWANPTLRTGAQQQTIGRPQGQGLQQGQAGQATNQQLQNQGHDDSGQSQFSGAGDDYRFGGQGGVGQLSGGVQPQTGNIEEFPPLGGAAGEIGPDRRAGLIQNAAAFGGNGNASAFPGLGQTRNGLPSPTDGQQERTLNPTVGGRSLPGAASRTPFENLRSTPQDSNQRATQPPGNLGFLGPQIGLRTGGELGTVGQRSQQGQFDSNFGENGGSSNNQILVYKRLSEMTDSERYGLPGLLTMIPLESPDYSSLAMGQDLTVLGLDLGRPDNSPLHPTFGSPFVESNAKPIIPPDFTLPAAYTVTNIPPLHTKMANFTSETVLAIFYQFPRDIMQEVAAQELYNRDWRWHMKLQQWMMKDPDLPSPVRLSAKEERGWYLFFDVNNWRRERREFELNYDHLDQRHGSPAKMSSSTQDSTNLIRQSLSVLAAAVREMTPAGARSIPPFPTTFNLLARPVTMTCRICNLPGHASPNIRTAASCRVALLALISFWESLAPHIALLYSASVRFQRAIQASVPTYAMRLDEGGLKGGLLEDVLVERVTRAWVKFLAHFRGIMAKANALLSAEEISRFEHAKVLLSGFLLDGLTMTELFERSLGEV